MPRPPRRPIRTEATWDVLDVETWWQEHPAGRARATRLVLVLWLAGLATGLVIAGIDEATAIRHEFSFLTDSRDPATLSSYRFRIGAAEHARQRARPHDVTSMPNLYASFCDTTGLYPIARHIKDSCGPLASHETIIQALLSFVQDKGIPASLRYINDPPGIEYPKYPLETLADGGGDCEDSAILFASLAEVLGYETILVLTSDHAFAAVLQTFTPTLASVTRVLEYKGLPYLPCECTGFGWVVGELSVQVSDIVGALDVDIVDPVVVATVSWVLVAAAGTVVVVLIIVIKKRGGEKHVINP